MRADPDEVIVESRNRSRGVEGTHKDLDNVRNSVLSLQEKTANFH